MGQKRFIESVNDLVAAGARTRTARNIYADLARLSDADLYTRGLARKDMPSTSRLAH